LLGSSKLFLLLFKFGLEIFTLLLKLLGLSLSCILGLLEFGDLILISLEFVFGGIEFFFNKSDLSEDRVGVGSYLDYFVFVFFFIY